MMVCTNCVISYRDDTLVLFGDIDRGKSIIDIKKRRKQCDIRKKK